MYIQMAIEVGMYFVFFALLCDRQSGVTRGDRHRRGSGNQRLLHSQVVETGGTSHHGKAPTSVRRQKKQDPGENQGHSLY